MIFLHLVDITYVICTLLMRLKFTLLIVRHDKVCAWCLVQDMLRKMGALMVWRARNIKLRGIFASFSFFFFFNFDQEFFWQMIQSGSQT